MNNDKDITKNKYFPTLPYMTTEGSQKFFGIILTLCALSFFGFFAIKPTISTILKLQKEFSDSKFVLSQLDTKVKNLTELRKQYFNLQSDMAIITSAITVQPDVHLLFAQIQSIAQTSGITIKKLQNSEVETLRSDKGTDKNYHSYSFSVAGSGSFENISKFTQILTNMERIVDISVFSVNNISDQINKPLEFDIQGIAFFKDSL
jgi:Tfp pilus assembly protein PilO